MKTWAAPDTQFVRTGGKIKMWASLFKNLGKGAVKVIKGTRLLKCKECFFHNLSACHGGFYSLFNGFLNKYTF